MIFTLDNTKLLLFWIDFKRNTVRNNETLFGAENELLFSKWLKKLFIITIGLYMFIIL